MEVMSLVHDAMNNIALISRGAWVLSERTPKDLAYLNVPMIESEFYLGVVRKEDVPDLSAAMSMEPGMVPSWQAFSKAASMDDTWKYVDKE